MIETTFDKILKLNIFLELVVGEEMEAYKIRLLRSY